MKNKTLKFKTLVPLMIIALITVTLLIFIPNVSAAQPAANIDQIRNGAYDDPWDPANWVNGNAGASNAHYIEGYSIAYRTVMTDLPIGTPITLTIGYDIKHSDKHAIDYLTNFSRINNPSHYDVFGHNAETINPLAGIAGVSPTLSYYTIPAPSSTGSPVPGQPTNSYNDLVAAEGPDSVKMTLFGGTISNIAYYIQGDLTTSNSETQINVTFTAASSTAVLAWGGHIGSRADWGYDSSGVPMSAGGISGSPYHMRLKEWTLNNLGNQDRSLSAVAVYAPSGYIIIHKNAIPDDPQDFTFTSTTLTPSPFILDDDGDNANTYSNFTIFSDLDVGTYDVSENVPTGWALTEFFIDDPSGDSTSLSNLNLAQGETINVYFNDTKNGTIIVHKDAIPDDPQDFTFTSGTLSPSPFYLDDDADVTYLNQRTFSNLLPGTYDVAEVVPAGWVLSSYFVSDGSPLNALVLGPGETINVYFNNTKLSKITVCKETDPDGDPTLFTFTPSYGSTFDLTDGQCNISGWLGANTYTVVETTPVGWELYEIIINDPDGESTFDLPTATATIDLDVGEQITVTFYNRGAMQGCTPGFWKNHLDCWEGYSPNQRIVDVFGITNPTWKGIFGNDNLLVGLSYGGGPGTYNAGKMLIHHAIAALLNAADSDINYPMSESGIITAVYNALMSFNRYQIISLKNQLDEYNNAGCPINAHCEPCTECD